MATQPWYQDGLRFECTQCGNCCTGAPGVVWVDDDDIRRIAEHTGRGEGEIRVMHTRPYAQRTSLQEFANGDCTFFDPRARRCTIYPVRPQQCRNWPFWDSNLETPEAWQEVQVECPGAGHGQIYSVEAIQEMVSQDEI
jgi:Fe-S-cluster containining protein